MRGAAVALSLSVTAACGSSDSIGGPKAVVTSSTTAEEAQAIDGPVMRYRDNSSPSGNLKNLLQGVLQLEGDCLYLLQSAIDQHFPVLWPAGTRWDAQSQSVVSPAGEVMPIGSQVEGRGGYFFISDVHLLAGSAASNLAAECVDRSVGQIVVVQNSGTSIGPATG